MDKYIEIRERPYLFGGKRIMIDGNAYYAKFRGLEEELSIQNARDAIELARQKGNKWKIRMIE